MNIAENAFFWVRRKCKPVRSTVRLTDQDYVHVMNVLSRNPGSSDQRGSQLKDVSTEALLAELKRRGEL